MGEQQGCKPLKRKERRGSLEESHWKGKKAERKRRGRRSPEESHWKKNENNREEATQMKAAKKEGEGK